MMPPRPMAPGQIQNQNPLANPAQPHAMNPNAVGPAALGGMSPKPGGVPSGMRGLPQGITPDMLQNPQFMAMLQQMMQQQMGGGQPAGFSKTILGR